MSSPSTALGHAAGAPPPADTLTNALGQTLDHLREIEGRLTAIRQKLAPTPEKSDATPTPAGGMLALALEVRNTASRLIARCNEIDTIL